MDSIIKSIIEKKKKEYDHTYRYKKRYGEFWECMMLVQEIQKEKIWTE